MRHSNERLVRAVSDLLGDYLRTTGVPTERVPQLVAEVGQRLQALQADDDQPGEGGAQARSRTINPTADRDQVSSNNADTDTGSGAGRVQSGAEAPSTRGSAAGGGWQTPTQGKTVASAGNGAAPMRRGRGRPKGSTDGQGLVRKNADRPPEELGLRPVGDPAVSIDESVQDSYLICLEDGERLQLLARHIKAKYGMTMEQYRAKWSLGPDYPSCAPLYSRMRSQSAANPRKAVREIENRA